MNSLVYAGAIVLILAAGLAYAFFSV